jgi:hypothetical protein
VPIYHWSYALCSCLPSGRRLPDSSKTWLHRVVSLRSLYIKVKDECSRVELGLPFKHDSCRSDHHAAGVVPLYSNHSSRWLAVDMTRLGSAMFVRLAIRQIRSAAPVGREGLMQQLSTGGTTRLCVLLGPSAFCNAASLCMMMIMSL